MSEKWTFYWQKTIAVDRMLLVVLGFRHTGHVPLWVFIRKESNIYAEFLNQAEFSQYCENIVKSGINQGRGPPGHETQSLKILDDQVRASCLHLFWVFSPCGLSIVFLWLSLASTLST